MRTIFSKVYYNLTDELGFHPGETEMESLSSYPHVGEIGIEIYCTNHVVVVVVLV